MDTTPIAGLVDRLSRRTDDVPLDEAGNPIWELPTCMEDELGGDNPLGNLLQGLAHAIARNDA